MLLETQALTKRYGAFTALDALDMRIDQGEVFGLLGPNGAGKSTALRLILGFLKPTSGSASIAGHDSWTDGVRARKKIAYLPGELRLYENMTGRQLLDFLSGLRGRPVRTDLQKIASHFDIDIDSPLATMSSGMKRKVALLLVLDPYADLIIMDEPTNTLDPTMREILLDEVREARKRGQAVFFSSHVMSEVEAVCDRVGVIRKGKLVFSEKMNALRTGRQVKIKLPSDSPVSELDGLNLVWRRERFLHMEYSGTLENLMEWIARVAPEDFSVEPMGLEGIYRKFHGEPQ